MKIRDIVNREIVNLTNCEHEPIHIPGSIQPHGFLFAIKNSDSRIDFCSSNIADYTGVRHEQALGKTIAELFGTEPDTKIENYRRTRKDNFAPPLVTDIAGKLYNVSFHESGETIVLEFEPHEPIAAPALDFYDQTRQFVGYMENSVTLQSLCQQVAEQTRRLTAYDRVMIYRFDEHYNGEVFGESKRDDLEPFLGLHYPHTDIPVQARELYKQNLIRLIVDIGYQPVPLYTIDDAPGKNLNLGNSILRSVSPIHVEYLSNIGVGATLTISLMHENDLWGLIACHHYSPKYIDKYSRNAAQLQGHFITSQINVRQLAEKHELAKNISTALEKVLNRSFELNRSGFGKMVLQQELLELCNASGVVIFVGEETHSNGVVPEPDDQLKLISFFKDRVATTFHTSNLSKIYPHFEKLRSSAAGLLWHCLNKEQNIGVMWFRRETVIEVNWAGDPNKAIIKDEKGLSPRKSFELWKEVVSLQSNVWSDAELSAASNFAHSLERHANLLFISEEEAKYRKLSSVLKETNDELENFNHISTHDLKELLRKIRLFGSRILDQHGHNLDPEVVDSINKMDVSAERMQKLITDLTAYSRLRQIADRFTSISLKDLLEQISFEIKEENTDTDVVIEVGNLPGITGNTFLLRQLFLNLITNSIKFSKPDVPSLISIVSSGVPQAVPEYPPDEEFIAVVVSDNGVGFENQYNELIFNIFSRLHPQSKYAGSGIGLALCKKIMQIHHGFIRAAGRLSEGAEFTLFFPAKKFEP